jgi:hypothetical protein
MLLQAVQPIRLQYSNQIKIWRTSDFPQYRKTVVNLKTNLSICMQCILGHSYILFDHGIKIPWIVGPKYHGTEFDIPWIGGLIYHGYWGQNSMDSEVDIPWVGGQNTMGRGFNIPYIEGLKYHG